MDSVYKLAAIRDQPIDIIDCCGEKICTVQAGPKTAILPLKTEISKAHPGIPVREACLKYGDHKYKDNDIVGVHVFKDLAPGATAKLFFTQLTAEEADREEGRHAALEKVKHGEKLSHLEAAHRADPEICLLAAENNASELQHAADSVKADRDTMLEALKINTTCMYYVADNLWQDRQFVTSAVSVDGLLLGQRMIPEQWRNDPEVVMIACEAHGFALKFASEELRDNRSVVFAAVNQRGTALMYASEELRSDYYVVMDAVRQNRMAIVHAKGGLREDDDIRAAAGQGPSDCKMLQKVEKIKKKFHELDANGDWFLSYEELESLLRKGNPELPDDEIRLLYDGMDTHHDGRVDFHEFCDYIFSEDN